MGFDAFHAVVSSSSPIRVPIDSPLGTMICIGVAALVGFVLFAVAVGMRNTFGGMRAQAQLAATGMPAQGRVVAVRDVGGSIKAGAQVPRHRLQIDLEVYPSNGQQPFRATSVQMISMLNFARFQPGAAVAVRYDPANPMRVVVVE